MNRKMLGLSTASALMLLAGASAPASAGWVKDHHIVLVSDHQDEGGPASRILIDADVSQSSMRVKASATSDGLRTVGSGEIDQAYGGAGASAVYKQTYTFIEETPGEEIPSSFWVRVDDSISGSASGYARLNGDGWSQPGVWRVEASSAGMVARDSAYAIRGYDGRETTKQYTFSSGTAFRTVHNDNPTTGTPGRASQTLSLNASAFARALHWAVNRSPFGRESRSSSISLRKRRPRRLLATPSLAIPSRSSE